LTGGRSEQAGKILTVLADVNVWIAAQNANRAGRTNTVSQRVLRYVTAGYVQNPPVQLVVSFKMIDTYRDVLRRQGYDNHAIEMAAGALIEMMKNGPRALDPYVVFGGTPDLAVLDTEDGGVLATAFAAAVDVLVTDNLADFAAGASEKYNTSTVRRAGGTTRQLSCQIHRRPNGRALIVAHPADFAHWIERGFGVSTQSIKATFERHSKPKSPAGKHNK
jgi:hypothetical protein